MNTRPKPRFVQAAATRSSLIATARRMFAQKGYHEAGTNELVAAAGVTRGALYHHFRDKEHLFEAVFRELAGELFAAASRSVEPLAADRWRQLQEGLQVHLQLIAASHEMQRILLIDGPAVFGWHRWRELQSEFSLGALVSSMEDLIAAKTIAPRDPLVAAHLVLAALNEAAFLIAYAEAPEEAGTQAGEALTAMVAGLR
ncbi:MAG TPA: helix-turn-helix domain-containing protein [Caulobacteraceae bacterium]|jgi:AcrR family transcriptional regulator